MHNIHLNYTEAINAIARDKRLRKRILANPKKTLTEFGIDLSQNETVDIVIARNDLWYFVIPAPNYQDLSHAQLAQISAGNFQTISTSGTITSILCASSISSSPVLGISTASTASSLVTAGSLATAKTP